MRKERASYIDPRQGSTGESEAWDGPQRERAYGSCTPVLFFLQPKETSNRFWPLLNLYPLCQAASQESKPAEAEFDEEEYRLTEIIKESALTFGEDAIETMNAKFKLARFYALESQLTKAAPLAEAVWRFRVLAWKGKDLPKSTYFLEPFCICLDLI
ncbi:hypothetical protein NA56DRAFT_663097 [Hyaloscypha hepaticicola]|uniref:Uncharacterized protein n=1 Tax=Hyaloscypha hepaticicola TaxID=2082293 RepID=A0A2J6PQM0_9HELO|nr:hypothetical protein NA56DRAFT_663097 [Hyaloscypha hepaticicola]